MRNLERRWFPAWLRHVGWTLSIGAQLSACATPNASASIALRIVPVADKPFAAKQVEADLASVRRILAYDGFSRIDPGPGPMAGPEHERIEFLFSQPDNRFLHGFVSRTNDDGIHLLVVDNRHGERDGFDNQGCRAIVSLRSSLRAQFGDRLLAPIPDQEAQQRSQLRACE